MLQAAVGPVGWEDSLGFLQAPWRPSSAALWFFEPAQVQIS